LYTPIGKGYSMDAVIVSALIAIGVTLLLVRRWRLPVGALTVLFALYAVALATQTDTYWDIPSIVAAGILADVLLAIFGDRMRSGNGFYAFGFAVPFVLTAGYLVSVDLHDGGLGWPPNMIFGAPFIAGFAGLLVAFCYAIPLAAPSAQAAEETSRYADPAQQPAVSPVSASTV
jgi:hypothetical protein